MAAGIGFVPEDRHREGLMLDMTVTENLGMANLDRFVRGAFLNRRQLAQSGQRTLEALSVRVP